MAGDRRVDEKRLLAVFERIFISIAMAGRTASVLIVTFKLLQFLLSVLFCVEVGWL